MEFRAEARKAVDEHVIKAWISEVVERGEHWVRCSELLAAYGYGKPIQNVSGSIDVNVTDARELPRERLLEIAASAEVAH